jgi:hypothetical protein
VAIDLFSSGAWGMAGAFIYGAPRFGACLFAARHSRGGWARCSIEFACALITGAIAAAAFSGWAQESLGQAPDHRNAIAAMIGLLANPTAPKLIDSLSTVITNVVTGRVLKKGDDT